MADNEIKVYEPINREDVKARIFEIRGFRVMLDSDIANYFGVTTGNLNKAKKRNINSKTEINESEKKDEISTDINNLSKLNKNDLEIQKTSKMIDEECKSKFDNYIGIVIYSSVNNEWKEKLVKMIGDI